MQIITSLNKLQRSRFKKPVVTWGVFDGVHRGHRKIIKEVVRQAEKTGGTSVILTFRQHPREILQKGRPLFITSLEHRLLLFGQLGVDVCLVLPFTKIFSQTSAEDFIRKFLLAGLKIVGIVVSGDNRFGKNRAGDNRLLEKIARENKIVLKIVPSVRFHGRVVSSTYIRTLVENGLLEQAAQLLGRPVSLLGTVVKGSGRGKKLGFPTANLDLHHELTPPSGVYAGRARVNNRDFNALTNIGFRPTFYKFPGGKIYVETHLLDFNEKKYGRLYGKNLEVRILRKIRDEKKFASPEELIGRIRKDINFSRKLC